MGGISVSSLGSIDWCQKSLNIILFITLTTLARTYHFLYRSAERLPYEHWSVADTDARSALNI